MPELTLSPSQGYMNSATVHFFCLSRSQIHERTISLRFLGIILRVLRLEDSEYNVYITNQIQTTFAHGKGGGE